MSSQTATGLDERLSIMWTKILEDRPKKFFT
jgi:hypothetical protein